MPLPKIVCALSGLLLALLTGCVSNPKPGPVVLPSPPAEMMIPPPPQGFYLQTLEAILSRSWNPPKSPPTDSEPVKH